MIQEMHIKIKIELHVRYGKEVLFIHEVHNKQDRFENSVNLGIG